MTGQKPHMVCLSFPVKHVSSVPELWKAPAPFVTNVLLLTFSPLRIIFDVPLQNGQLVLT